ncbi:globin [Lihuaxuella thermophila]|uniref:Hemoglobin n=1 Tax=Lihuaxuella thermophila TaxID=1173111 RepID=A0A1H8IDR4_9BACL|nr:globin [Lihuaxuella thermophila]SEN66943.1 hemoglobin [Lihuaxuella thermophila]
MHEMTTLYEKIGGAEKVRQLVEAFYPKVQAHPLLKPLFPEQIRPVMEKQYMFLTQFLGGPPLYTEKYGHPMLRARHLPFPITPSRANAWLECMDQAMDEAGITGQEREEFFSRLVIAAHHMINQPEPASE